MATGRRKSRNPDMRYITRYDYQDRHGWWVRIQRRLEKGDKPLVVSRFFADDKNGGTENALVVAKGFRQGALETAPAPRQKKHVPDGIRRGYGYSREEDGIVHGWFRDDRGKIHRITASIERWGKAGAHARITEWLAKKTKGGVEAVA